MRIVRTAAREIVGADGATFVLRDGDKCFYADEEAISPLWKGLRFPMEACISGWAMRHKASTVIEDIYEDPRIPRAAYEPTFVRSLVMVPIRRLDPIGAIGTYWASRRTAPDFQVRLLQSLADSTSIAMENVAILQDLDQRVRARTAELEAANVELAAFNAAVSHDLRNPINAIMGFSKVILEQDSDQLTPRSQGWLQRIHGASERMTELIEDLMRLSSASDRMLTLAPVDLSSLADGILDGLRQAEPERTVEVHVERGLALVGDAGLWQIALANLLSNAWKYSAQTHGARIEMGRTIQGQDDAFFVRDNGIGFDMAQADRLFLPFNRLASANGFKGTGIGLVTVKRIVERHGGRIWAESSPGAGATFWIAMPNAVAAT
jgi:signal transduction histidine kinase